MNALFHTNQFVLLTDLLIAIDMKQQVLSKPRRIDLRLLESSGPDAISVNVKTIDSIREVDFFKERNEHSKNYLYNRIATLILTICILYF